MAPKAVLSGKHVLALLLIWFDKNLVKCCVASRINMHLKFLSEACYLLQMAVKNSDCAADCDGQKVPPITNPTVYWKAFQFTKAFLELFTRWKGKQIQNIEVMFHPGQSDPVIIKCLKLPNRAVILFQPLKDVLQQHGHNSFTQLTVSWKPCRRSIPARLHD